MKLSFEGIRSIALRQLRALEEVAKTAEDYDEYDHEIMHIEACISAYHDCLLAVMKGDADIQDIRDFLLAFKTPEEIKAIPYCGEVVKFEPSDKSNQSKSEKPI